MSHQTVSRVVNDRGVSPSTRARVLEAVALLGYRPNRAARVLAGGHSQTIGVVRLNSTLYGVGSTFTSIQQAAFDADYTVVASSVHSADQTALLRAVDQLAGQGVDGLVIVAPLVSLSNAVASLPVELPVVLVEGLPSVNHDVVTAGQYGGACAATRHLLELGHETVWHVAGPADWLEAGLRTDGWRHTLERAGRHVHPPLQGDWSARSGFAAGRRLAEAPEVTAVFVANDAMAIGLLRAAAEAGLRVPEDLSVVGFDDIPEAAYLNPPLTTVRQDFSEVGRQSVERLVAQIARRSRAAFPAQLLVPAELVIRSSTGLRPAVSSAPAGRPAPGAHRLPPVPRTPRRSG